MPTMPSFGTFAPKPDVAGASQRRTQLQLQAAQAAASLQMQMAQLRQQRELANMEAEIRVQQAQRDNMLRTQQMQVDSEYKNQVLGLQERKLDQEAKEMARQFQREAAFTAALDEIEKDPALTPEEKQQRTASAWLRSNPSSSGAASMLNATRPARDVTPKVFQTRMPSGEEFSAIQTASGSLHQPRREQAPQDKAAEKERDRQQKLRDSFLQSQYTELVKERDFRRKEHSNKQFKKGSKAETENLDAINDIQRKMNLLEAQLMGTPALPASPSAPRTPAAQDPLGLFQ